MRWALGRVLVGAGGVSLTNRLGIRVGSSQFDLLKVSPESISVLASTDDLHLGDEGVDPAPLLLWRVLLHFVANFILAPRCGRGLLMVRLMGTHPCQMYLCYLAALVP